MQLPRLPSRRLADMVRVFDLLRRRPAAAKPRGSPHTGPGRCGVQPRPCANQRLHLGTLPTGRLPVGRVGRLEHLLVFLQRWPADASPAHCTDAEQWRQALRGAGQSGGSGLQHAVMLSAEVPGRLVGRLGRVVRLLPELRRGHHLPLAASRPDGERVRLARDRQSQGDSHVQHGHPMRASCGLPLLRLGSLERMLADLQRCHEAFTPHPALWLWGRGLLRRSAEGHKFLQPSAR